MNQIRGILLAFVLLTGSVIVPVPSFTQGTDDYGSFSYVFEILQSLISSGDVEIITYGSSVTEFSGATIILTSSTTTTDPVDPDETGS